MDQDTDMLHFNDMMGTAREDLSTVGFAKVEVNPTEVGSEVQGTPNGYVVTADGKPLAMVQPSDENQEKGRCPFFQVLKHL